MKLKIYSGLDGCGKSLKIEKLKEQDQDLISFYEPTYFKDKPINKLLEIYLDKNINILDRCFLLDEIVYSKVWNEKSLITKERSLELLKELSLVKNIEINIGINTFMEYTLIHEKRKEKNYPDYYKALNEWYNLIEYISSNKEDFKIYINIFWYNKILSLKEFSWFVNKELESKEV